MSEASPETGDVLSRGARGALALGVRQAVVQLLNMAGAIVLARVLTTAEFGVYGITVFVMSFLVVFGDAGLAAGLVREHAEPHERDYQAIFTFQQVLVFIVAAVGFTVAGPLFARAWPGAGIGHLVPALFAALVLASFQTTAAARLERHLEFDKLAVVEVMQALAFNGVAVACALGGVGADSMAAALVARAATGAVCVHAVTRRPIAWHWDWTRVRSRLHFGLSYQGAALVNLIRDGLVTVFVGAALGNAAVGRIFFGRMLAFYPFVIVYMMQRLLMPLFARLQASAKDLRRAVELSVFAVAALVVPVQTTVWALQEPVVRIVFGSQWLDSLPVYRWLWFAATLEPELVVAIALLNALGHADRTLRFVATTTAFLWLAGVPLLLLVGPTGYGIAATLMLAIKWRLVAEADATTDTRSLAIVVPVWISGLASAFVTALVARAWPPSSPLSLAVLLAACLATYSVFLYLAARDRTTTALRWLRAQLVLAMAGGAAPGAARSAAGSLD